MTKKKSRKSRSSSPKEPSPSKKEDKPERASAQPAADSKESPKKQPASKAKKGGRKGNVKTEVLPPEPAADAPLQSPPVTETAAGVTAESAPTPTAEPGTDPAAEPATATEQFRPATEESTPATEESTPATEESMPAAEESTPAADESAPAADEPAPAATAAPEQASFVEPAQEQAQERASEQPIEEAAVIEEFPWLKNLMPKPDGQPNAKIGEPEKRSLLSAAINENPVAKLDSVQSAAAGAPSLSEEPRPPAVTLVNAEIISSPEPKDPPDQPRKVAKTLLETDVSKFSESSQAEQVQAQPPAEALPPQEAVPPAGRKVAKTMLETDISKFVEPPPEPPAPPQARKVAKTLLETDISKFMDQPQIQPEPGAPGQHGQPEKLMQPESPQSGVPPQNRKVAKTMLETDISKFSDHLPPQPAQQPPPAPFQPQPTGLSRADSPSFADVEVPQSINLVPQQPRDIGIRPPQDTPGMAPPPRDIGIIRQPQDPVPEPQEPGRPPHDFEFLRSSQEMPYYQSSENFEFAQSEPEIGFTHPSEEFGVEQSAHDMSMMPQPEPEDEDNWKPFQPTGQQPPTEPPREVAKTLLDKDLIYSQLATSMERIEQKEKERQELAASQPMKQFIPIEDFKTVTEGCPFRWDDPYAKERIVFCGKCEQQVYNFEGLQLPEAQKLIYQRESIENPHLYKRDDGKFMTRDCPVAWKKRNTPFIIAGVSLLLVALLALMFIAAQAFMPHEPTFVPTDSDSSSSSTQSTSPSSSSSPFSPANSGGQKSHPSTGSAGHTAKPGANTPAKPGAKTPAKPGAKTPAKSGAKTPAKSGAKTPAKSGAKTPAKPGAQTPADSGPKAPAKPGAKPPAAAKPFQTNSKNLI